MGLTPQVHATHGPDRGHGSTMHNLVSPPPPFVAAQGSSTCFLAIFWRPKFFWPKL